MNERLLPCASCGRHFRTTETRCPFCGAVNEAPAGGAEPGSVGYEERAITLYGAPPLRVEEGMAPAYGAPPLARSKAAWALAALALVAAAIGAIMLLRGG